MKSAHGPRPVAVLACVDNRATLPHGMPTTHAETINADLLTFLKA